MRRVVASNLLWMLADRGLQVATGIVVVGMLARALGTEGFGHFQYAQSLVYIAAAIPLICSAEVVVPRLVQLPSAEAQHKLMAHAFAVRFSAGIIAYALICLYVFLTGQPADTWMPAVILGIAVMLREPFGVVIAWMQARTHNRPNVVFNIIALAARASVIGTLFFLGIKSIPAYASAFALEAAIASALLAWYYLVRAPRSTPARDGALMRELVRDGSLFWISFILTVTARRADQLILKPLVPVADLGAYAATMQILDNFAIVASILAAGIAPVYVYAQTASEAARRNIVRVTCGMAGIGLLGALLLVVCAEWIVHLLYGNAFGATVSLLRLAAVATTLLFVDVGLSLWPVYLRRPRWVAFKWALVLLTTVAVDLIAIPRMGTLGAVLGYAIANGVAVVFGLVLWHRTRQAGRTYSACPEAQG